MNATLVDWRKAEIDRFRKEAAEAKRSSESTSQAFGIEQLEQLAEGRMRLDHVARDESRNASVDEQRAFARIPVKPNRVFTLIKEHEIETTIYSGRCRLSEIEIDCKQWSIGRAAYGSGSTEEAEKDLLGVLQHINVDVDKANSSEPTFRDLALEVLRAPD